MGDMREETNGSRGGREDERWVYSDFNPSEIDVLCSVKLDGMPKATASVDFSEGMERRDTIMFHTFRRTGTLL